MKSRKLLMAVVVIGALVAISFPGGFAAAIVAGESDNGILVEEWSYPLCPRYWWGLFGSSAAIADLGPDVNNKGTEPDSDLEIVNGCDGCWFYSDELGDFVAGLWRCWDSQGNWEWATNTQSDEARGSPAIIDLDGDGNLEIAGGTTSGETVEVMDRFGNWFWTFPNPPRAGNFYYPDGPAVADLCPGVLGPELVIGNRAFGTVLCLQGVQDGADDGITANTYPVPGSPYAGVEGDDWDVLWMYQTGGNDMYSTPAVGDVDCDGDLEVVIGSDDGSVYVLNGADGALEHQFSTGGAVYASPALANLDSDCALEIVIGSLDNMIYCFEWNGSMGTTQWTFSTSGAVYSSAAIGDVDFDGDLEIVVGSNDVNVYCLDASGSQEWSYATGGAVYSSPALAKSFCAGEYAKEWPMFRHDPCRTGFYGVAPTVGLDVYVGSADAYLYLLDGSTGAMIDRFLTNGEIRTSPSVADVDGDNKLEIFCYDWSTIDTFWCVEDTRVCVCVDIKPMSWPNPLNVRAKGVLPVAILGTADFDVSQIDPATVRLEGVAPLRWALEDVGTAGDPLAGPDGFTDLSLKFDTREIVSVLGAVNDGDNVVLHLTGNLKPGFGGTPILGQDVVIIIKKK